MRFNVRKLLESNAKLTNFIVYISPQIFLNFQLKQNVTHEIYVWLSHSAKRYTDKYKGVQFSSSFKPLKSIPREKCNMTYKNLV